MWRDEWCYLPTALEFYAEVFYRFNPEIVRCPIRLVSLFEINSTTVFVRPHISRIRNLCSHQLYDYVRDFSWKSQIFKNHKGYKKCNQVELIGGVCKKWRLFSSQFCLPKCLYWIAHFFNVLRSFACTIVLVTPCLLKDKDIPRYSKV